MEMLLEQIRSCRHCEQHLPDGVRPVLTASPHSKIVVVGQAPGRRVHVSGIPWNDVSGDTLREWMGVDKDTFYNPNIVALVPMGFCYPGTNKYGDLPPRQECAPLWHQKLLDEMKEVQLIILAGRYAQARYLGADAKINMTDTVRNYKNYAPLYFPLPHPSPKNKPWQENNVWFALRVLPELKKRVTEVLQTTAALPS